MENEVMDTCYCTYTNDTVYCNGICSECVYCNGVCSECGNKDIKLDEDGHPIWE